MKEVKLTKVSRDEVATLQAELQAYADIERLGYNFWSNEDFLNAILAVDIAHRLWIFFRRKVEAEQSQFSMRFKINEAVIILKCCHWERDGRGEYEKHVVEKYKNIIDQQLISLVHVTHQKPGSLPVPQQ